jgi:hypoxia-inducible factor 1-alpha inhibitor (HIF hydroxylase)
LDRSAQVDLQQLERSARRFPRAAHARGATVLLQPGDVLFLPAYGWHEVLTDAPGRPSASGGAESPLCVSVNFWFSAAPKLTRPPARWPLDPMLEVALGQQLQMLVADALDDRASLLPPFVRACRKQLEALTARGADRSGAPVVRRWGALHKTRPVAVDAVQWEALFEVVVATVLLWMPAPADVLPFFTRHLDDAKFALALR